METIKITIDRKNSVENELFYIDKKIKTILYFLQNDSYGFCIGYYSIRTYPFLKNFYIDKGGPFSFKKSPPIHDILNFIRIANEYIVVHVSQKQNYNCDNCFSENVEEIKDTDEFICTDCSFIYNVRLQKNKNIQCKSYSLKSNFLKAIVKFQGKSFVPESVLDKIRSELKNRQIISVKRDDIIKILKDFKENKYYDDLNSIYYLITNTTPPSLEKFIPCLLQKHSELEYAYTIVKDPARINSMNVNFKLNKLLEQCGYCTNSNDNYAFLKTDTKLQEHEEKWMEICKITNWN